MGIEEETRTAETEGPKGSRVFTYKDVGNHTKVNDCWLLIGGKVYDVTSFLMDHPGGHAILLAATGKDATEDFEDVGHSDDAIKMMQDYLIGTIVSSSVPPGPTVPTFPKSNDSDKSRDFFVRIFQFLVPLAILALVVAKNYFMKESEPAEL